MSLNMPERIIRRRNCFSAQSRRSVSASSISTTSTLSEELFDPFHDLWAEEAISNLATLPRDTKAHGTIRPPGSPGSADGHPARRPPGCLPPYSLQTRGRAALRAETILHRPRALRSLRRAPLHPPKREEDPWPGLNRAT